VPLFFPSGCGLLFDMDGVLIDSTPAHTRAWEIYLQRLGRPPNGIGRLMHGKRNDQIVRAVFGAELDDESVFRHGAAKERVYRELMAPVLKQHVVAGAGAFLEVGRGAACAVASNAEPANIDFVLDGTGFRQYFAAVVDGHQVTHPKPHPEIYLLAAERLGRHPGRCIVFEDSLAGVRAARAAGMKVAGVETSLRPVPETDLSIRDFEDPRLPAWLEQEFSRW